MDMTGDRRLPAPRARVWAALNDPEVLRASIPGCKTLEPSGATTLKATAAVKIGPIATNFTGEVRLLDLVPPESYRIEGSGQGGNAGHAKGGATVTLTEEGAETVLHYAVKAEVGGKLAQLGARLIDASAKQMADQFFDNFARAVSVPETDAAGVADAAAVVSGAPPAAAAFNVFDALPKDFLGYPLFAWVAVAVWLFLVFSLFVH